MKNYKQYLAEGTESASVQEAAICIAYNMHHNDLNYEEATQQAGIASSTLSKVTDSMMEIGKKVVAQAGNLGPFLDHSGRGAAGVNHYASTLGTGASDVTPKTDFIGDAAHAISLKKAGGKGPGAQLMSAKSGEASGVVQSAIKHYENNAGNIADDKQMKKVMTILGNKMKATARNDINILVGEGKDNFENWMQKHSSRREQLIALSHKPKDVEDHIRGELSLLRVTSKSPHAKSWLIKGVKPLGKRAIKDLFQEYIQHEKAKIVPGKGKNKEKYLKHASPEELTQEALKTQLTQVLEVAMSTQGWQTELEKFFNGNQEFKKYLVYEASSGMFKFTGQAIGKGNYKGGEAAVAKQILVFNDTGIKVYHQDIWKWSKQNTHLAQNLSISYKGSGRSRYIKMAIMANKIYDHELPTLMEEFDNIDKELLTEGILGNIGSAVKKALVKFTQAIWNFVDRIIQKVIIRLNALLATGLVNFTNILGVTIQGGYVLPPAW